MTTEEMKKTARTLLDFGLKMLKETGEVAQMLHLALSDGSTDVIGVGGDVTNSGRGKDALSDMLRKRVAKGDVDAVFMLWDTYIGIATPEQEKERARLNLSVKDAADLGIIDGVREAVTILGESPDYRIWIKQYYRRPKGGRETETEGEPEIVDSLSTGWKMGAGRFAGYWPRKQAN